MMRHLATLRACFAAESPDVEPDVLRGTNRSLYVELLFQWKDWTSSCTTKLKFSEISAKTLLAQGFVSSGA